LIDDLLADVQQMAAGGAAQGRGQPAPGPQIVELDGGTAQVEAGIAVVAAAQPPGRAEGGLVVFLRVHAALGGVGPEAGAVLVEGLLVVRVGEVDAERLGGSGDAGARPGPPRPPHLAEDARKVRGVLQRVVGEDHVEAVVLEGQAAPEVCDHVDPGQGEAVEGHEARLRGEARSQIESPHLSPAGGSTPAHEGPAPSPPTICTAWGWPRRAAWQYQRRASSKSLVTPQPLA